METIAGLDEIVEGHPRLTFAHNDLYLYFFGPEAKEAWVGREIVGHLAKAPENFNLFDSFQGEGFEWHGELKDLYQLSGEELVGQGEKLKSLAGEALAKTWRVRINPLEMGNLKENHGTEPFKITFQFHKMG
jgi:hypothetical protein